MLLRLLEDWSTATLKKNKWFKTLNISLHVSSAIEFVLVPYSCNAKIQWSKPFRPGSVYLGLRL